MIKTPDLQSDLDRFFSRIAIHPATKCWLWCGSCDRHGYAQFWSQGKNTRAHKFIFELHYGSLLEGEQIDHVRVRGCLYRSCVNPYHLEAVSLQENLSRGTNFNLSKKQCIHGHLFSHANTYWYRGRRICKVCARLRERVYYYTKK